MKKIMFLFLLILSTNISIGQISIQELIQIGNMDSETFEIFAIDRGYSFYKFHNNTNYKGIMMTKVEGGTTRYIACYSLFYSSDKVSNYQTSNINELKSIYQELKKIGFVLESSEDVDGFYNKVYNRGKESIRVYIKSDWVEIGYENFN